MSITVLKKIILDTIDYEMLCKQTRYFLGVGLLAVTLGSVAGFLMGYLRGHTLYAGILGGSILAGIFTFLWAIFFVFHLLTYINRKTIIEGTIIKKSIHKRPKGNPLYILHFEGKEYNIPISFYNQVLEGRQVRLHFSNILFLFIRGEIL
jgi:hypothetical protein